MKNICTCGTCKNCRQRACMKKLRAERKELEREEEEFRTHFEMLSIHGAYTPSCSLNPHVRFDAKTISDDFDYNLVPIRSTFLKKLYLKGSNY